MSTTRNHATRSTVGGGLVSLALLLGFYALVVVLIAGMWLANLALLYSTGRIVGYLVVGAFLGSAGLIRGLVRLDRPEDAEGLALDGAAQPELWSVVLEAAQGAGTKPPSEVYLVDQVNAGVSERSRLLGLVGGRRRLLIGLPLVDAVSRDELRAVLAHEFGHFAAGHGRLAALRYRTHASIGRAATLSGPAIRLVLGWYFALFQRVTNRFNRAQERYADLLAAEHVGNVPMARALVTIEVAGAVYDDYVGEVLVPILDRGDQFPAMFAAWPHFLDARLRAGAAQKVLQPALENGRSDPADSHPPLAERLASLGFGDRPVPPQPVDAPGATTLLRSLDALRRQLATDVARRARLDPATAPVVEPADLARRMVEHRDRRLADALAAVTARAVGETEPAPLGRTLQAIHELGVDRLAAVGGATNATEGRALVEELLTGSVRGLLITSVPDHHPWLDPESFEVKVTSPRGGAIDARAVAHRLMEAPGAITALAPELGDGGLVWQWPTAVSPTAEAPERMVGFLSSACLGDRFVLVLRTERSIVLLPVDLPQRAADSRRGKAGVSAAVEHVAGRLLRDVAAETPGVVVAPLATTDLTAGIPGPASDKAGNWRLVLTTPDGAYELTGTKAPAAVTGGILKARLMALRSPRLTLTNMRGKVMARRG